MKNYTLILSKWYPYTSGKDGNVGPCKLHFQKGPNYIKGFY